MRDGGYRSGEWCQLVGDQAGLEYATTNRRERRVGQPTIDCATADASFEQVSSPADPVGSSSDLEDLCRRVSRHGLIVTRTCDSRRPFAMWPSSFCLLDASGGVLPPGPRADYGAAQQAEGAGLARPAGRTGLQEGESEGD